MSKIITTSITKFRGTSDTRHLIVHICRTEKNKSIGAQA